jgi:malonyl CoA-acyl carrier protein transacylase
MTAVVLGAVAALRSGGLSFDLALGHSLGELAAWASLDGVSHGAAIDVAARRGRALADCCQDPQLGMLALPPMEESEVMELIAATDDPREVCLAVHNSPTRWVLAGRKPILRQISKERGGSLLSTPGAWHSPAMSPARAAFLSALREVEIAPTPKLIMNETGSFLGDRPGARERIIDLLVRQVDGVVRFADCVHTLRNAGVRHLVIAGPGKIVRKLLRDNWSEFEDEIVLHRVESAADVDSCLEKLA